MYSTGQVLGRSTAGGLVGENQGILEASFYAKTNAAGAAINTGSAFNTLGQGRSWVELTQLSTFADWDIDDQGGSGRAWRIYDGVTTLLLRSFLRPVSVTVDCSGISDKVYDGHVASGPLQFTVGEPGAALDGQLGYASTGSNAGR